MTLGELALLTVSAFISLLLFGVVSFMGKKKIRIPTNIKQNSTVAPSVENTQELKASCPSVFIGGDNLVFIGYSVCDVGSTRDRTEFLGFTVITAFVYPINAINIMITCRFPCVIIYRLYTNLSWHCLIYYHEL
jgi:hypothetical protein